MKIVFRIRKLYKACKQADGFAASCKWEIATGPSSTSESVGWGNLTLLLYTFPTNYRIRLRNTERNIFVLFFFETMEN